VCAVASDIDCTDGCAGDGGRAATCEDSGDGAAEADTGVGPCCTLPVSQSEIRSQASADGAALAPAVLFSPGTAGDGNCGGDASSCWVGAEGVASGGTAAGDTSNGGTGAGNGVRDAAEGATGTASAVMDVLLNTE